LNGSNTAPESGRYQSRDRYIGALKVVQGSMASLLVQSTEKDRRTTGGDPPMMRAETDR
jgi:hypothetical protein